MQDQKNMNDNRHPCDAKLQKLGTLQFLRINEIYLLRAVHRTFNERRKNHYRKDIITHFTCEMIVSALSYFPGASRDLNNVKDNLVVLTELGIIINVAHRRKYPQYRQKNESLDKAVPKQGGAMDSLVYDFDVKLVREILKLLHSIEYVQLKRCNREFLACLTCTPSEGWWAPANCNVSVLGMDGFTNRARNAQEDEINRQFIDVDKRPVTHLYRTTDYGKKVIDVWNQVTQLIEKPNEEACQTVSGLVQSTAEDSCGEPG